MADFQTEIHNSNSKKIKLKKINKIVLFGTLMLPSVAFAHGEEVIWSLISQIVILILVLVAIGLIKWKLKGKLLLILLYFLSIILAELSIINIPYFKNEILINFILLFIPIIVISVSYFTFRKKFERSKKNEN